MVNKEFCLLLIFLFSVAESIINLLDLPKKTCHPRVPARDAFEVIL